MQEILRLVSLLSLGDSYGSFLTRSPVSTLSEGSLKTVARLVLAPRGLKPDLSSSVLKETAVQLKAIADVEGIKNLSELLQNQTAASAFFSWAGGRLSGDEAPEGDSLAEKFGMLSSLKELDFIPTDKPEDYEAFTLAVKGVSESDRVEEFAMLAYNKALETGQSIREYLTSPANRPQIAALFFTAAGRDEGANPLNPQQQERDKEYVPNRNSSNRQHSNSPRFAISRRRGLPQ